MLVINDGVIHIGYYYYYGSKDPGDKKTKLMARVKC